MCLIKLGELFKITSGGTPSKTSLEFYEGGKIPWIRTGDLKAKNIYNGSEYITELALEKSSAKLFPKDTVLIAMYGATIGATSILKIEATTNQACCAFLPSDKVIPEYLYYFFRANKEKIVNMGVGGAQPNISATILKNIKIPIVELNHQTKVIEVLDKAQELIDKRKAQIEALNELVKSRFVEMFGDPLTNPKSLPEVQLGKISKLITKGASPSWQGFDYVDDDTETLFVTSENVREGFLNFEKTKYIQDEFNSKQKRSILHRGDFLINIVGASIGRAAQFDMDVKANINQAVALVRLKPEILNDKYLLTYLNSSRALQMYESMQTSVARANLSLQNINDLEILIPSLELQNEFESFYIEIDKLKFEMQKDLGEMENNFNSLMQKAFSGELFK